MAAPPSRFLALPAELREKIYEYAFADTKMVIDGVVSWKGAQASSRYPSLLAVNKQLHNEAMTSFYKYSTFRITARDGDLHGWLHSVPTPLRAKITSIGLFIPSQLVWMGDYANVNLREWHVAADLKKDGLAIQNGVLINRIVKDLSLIWSGAEQKAATPCPEWIMCEPCASHLSYPFKIVKKEWTEEIGFRAQQTILQSLHYEGLAECEMGRCGEGSATLKFKREARIAAIGGDYTSGRHAQFAQNFEE
ncbi:hypothetical protein LTR27_002814 [Elasticomyces elasticus]|nr:hypothetical protein LTR27_002814 [Elasticomyces elasticus]